MFPGTLAIIQEAAFIAHQKAEFVTYTTLIKVIGKVGVSLHLLTHGYGVVSLLVVTVVFEYVGMVCYLYFMLRHIITLRWEFELPFILQLARDIKTFAALSLVAGLFAQPEIVILSLIGNEAQVGIYSAALKLITVWQLIPAPFMDNVLSLLSRSYHYSDEKPGVIQEKSIKYLMAVALPLAVGIMTAAGPIINLFYGPGFEGSVTVLHWLAWTVPMTFLNSVLWRTLTARGEQHLDLRVRTITTVARLGLGFLLISSLGYLGAAIGTLIIFALNDLLLAIYVQRDGTRLYLLHLTWRFALAALGMGVFILAFGQQLHLLALVPIAAVIYGVLVILLKGFSSDDLALFRKIWQPGMSGSRELISTN
jgi:O-antigen/teichoic acid export membrane protein